MHEFVDQLGRFAHFGEPRFTLALLLAAELTALVGAALVLPVFCLRRRAAAARAHLALDVLAAPRRVPQLSRRFDRREALPPRRPPLAGDGQLVVRVVDDPRAVVDGGDGSHEETEARGHRVQCREGGGDGTEHLRGSGVRDWEERVRSGEERGASAAAAASTCTVRLGGIPAAVARISMWSARGDARSPPLYSQPSSSSAAAAAPGASPSSSSPPARAAVQTPPNPESNTFPSSCCAARAASHSRPAW